MYRVRYFPTPYLMTPIMLPKILRMVEGCIRHKAATSFAVKWRSCEIGFSVAGSGAGAGSTTLRLRALACRRWSRVAFNHFCLRYSSVNPCDRSR
jgi:hypothetical protein